MTVGRRPPGRRPRRARSTLRHRGRPTLSSACPYLLSCPISSSLAPFALARTSPDLGVHGLLDPAEPELGAAARLGDGVARASLVEAEPELVFRNEERAQDVSGCPPTVSWRVALKCWTQWSDVSGSPPVKRES